MLKTILLIAIVVAILVGGLMTLYRTGRAGMPNQDVLRRAKQREKDLESTEEKDDSGS